MVRKCDWRVESIRGIVCFNTNVNEGLFGNIELQWFGDLKFDICMDGAGHLGQASFLMIFFLKGDHLNG